MTFFDYHIKQKIGLLFCAILGTFLSLAPVLAFAKAPPVNAVISTKAIGIFTTPTGKSAVIYSNETIATIIGVSTLSLSLSQDTGGSASSVRTFSHILTNTGNVPAVFDLALTQMSADFNAVSGALFVDQNCDGAPDSTISMTTLSATHPTTWAAGTFASTPLLQPNQSQCYVVTMLSPTTASVGNKTKLSLEARSNPVFAAANNFLPLGTAFNQDMFLVDNRPDIVVTKSMTLISGPSPNQGLEVVLTYANRGLARAERVTLLDIIGHSNLQRSFVTALDPNAPDQPYDTTGMSYVPGSALWSGKATPLSDSADGDEGGVDYHFDSGTGDVKAVIASIESGESGVFRFRVNIAANLLPGNADLTSNRAVVKFSSGVNDFFQATNLVPYTISTSSRLLTPNLNITVTGDSTLPVASQRIYSFQINNTGTQATSGPMTVSMKLEPGLHFEEQLTSLGTWVCASDDKTSDGETVVCVSSSPVSAMNGVNPGLSSLVQFNVRAVSGFFTTFPTPRSIKGCVAGGADPGAAGGARCSTFNFNVVQALAQSAVSGRIWMNIQSETGSRIFNQDKDKAIKGWKAVLCPYDPQEDAVGGAVSAVLNDNYYGWSQSLTGTKPTATPCVDGKGIAQAVSGDDGSFSMTSLLPGLYKLTFLDSTGKVVVGTAYNNNTTVASRSFLHWSHRFLVINLDAEESIVKQDLPLDQANIVYDAAARTPVAGAKVTIIGPNGFDASKHLLAGAAGTSQTTTVTNSTADGLYQFILVGDYPAGIYRLDVVSPSTYLPAPTTFFPVQPGSLTPPGSPCFTAFSGCSVDQTGSSLTPTLVRDPFYFLSFNFTSGTPTAIINNHIPLVSKDSLSGLFVQKVSDRSVVEVSDFVNYTITVKNVGSTTQQLVKVSDWLPKGFSVVRNSMRVDGVPITPTFNTDGSFYVNLGDMAYSSSHVITYRASVGMLAASSSQAVNRARATSRIATSNMAQVSVRVSAGVFSDRAFLQGKVFLDCNGDGIKQFNENGIPSVRLYTADGSFVITDVYGDYSLYGLLPRLNVIKLDPVSLPKGASVGVTNNRQAGVGSSEFLDLTKGELHRSDFAVTGCSDEVIYETKDRIVASLDPLQEAARLIEQRLDLKTVVTEQAASTINPQATGFVGVTTNRKQNKKVPELNGNNSQLPGATIFDQPQLLNRTTEELEKDVELAKNNRTDFIYPNDKTVLAVPQTMVRVKGPLGAKFELFVNGRKVTDLLVGKRIEDESKKLLAWEYIGVNLDAGKNALVIKEIDPFGNVRYEKSTTITAPGKMSKLDLAVQDSPIADESNPIRFKVRVLDDKDVVVGSRIPVTIESRTGLIVSTDLNPKELGTQVFIENGELTFYVRPPANPQSEVIKVSSGVLSATIEFQYLPLMRPLVGVGFIEGVVGQRDFSGSQLLATNNDDGFERQINQGGNCSTDKKTCTGLRGSLFLKGKIKGDYLLTLAYDSDKDLSERLFRDLQPDQFYPVYGDSSVKGFDAQSSQRLYVRLDKGNSFFLLGDFGTSSNSEGRKLSQYSRSLTGAEWHYESNKTKVTTFVTQDTLKQQIEELAANGTSGPFQLVNVGSAFINSEKVEILVRDRNQPNIILSATTIARFNDYEIERDTGRIYLKAPLSSFDTNFNPQSLRITYEIDQGGRQFLTYGVEGQAKLTDKLEVGGIALQDENPNGKYAMESLNAIFKLAEKSFLIAETVFTHKNGNEGTGNRLELKHDSDILNFRAYAMTTTKDFYNQSSILTTGRREAGLKGTYKLRSKTSLEFEAIDTKDHVTGANRQGALFNINNALGDLVRAEFGIRASHDVTVSGASANSSTVAASSQPGFQSNDLLTARVKLTTLIPEHLNTSAYLEYEQNLENSSANSLAVGADWRFYDKGKAYIRHTLISSLNSPWALNQTTPSHTTLVGLEGNYMPGGQAYSEYRVDSAADAKTANAAVGLRNTFDVSKGLKLGTTMEKIFRIEGVTNESEAATAALEYTANQDWKGSVRTEVRKTSTDLSTLYQVGGLMRIDTSWTGIGRYVWQRTVGTGLDRSQRMQLGAAYRDHETNRLSMLNKYELRLEDKIDATNNIGRVVHIVSTHVNYKVSNPWTISGRFALKSVNETSAGITGTIAAALVSGRVNVDLNPKWDLGAQVSRMMSGPSYNNQAQTAYGLEAGYLAHQNARVSLGYNLVGFTDKDFRELEYTNSGLYLRLRVKFDESAFGWLAPELKQP